MRSFFNIDPPRNLFSSPETGSKLIKKIVVDFKKYKNCQKIEFSDPQKATILYQLNRHELIEAAAGSQDAIEVFLSHKVEAQNLLKLSILTMLSAFWAEKSIKSEIRITIKHFRRNIGIE